MYHQLEITIYSMSFWLVVEPPLGMMKNNMFQTTKQKIDIFITTQHQKNNITIPQHKSKKSPLITKSSFITIKSP